MAVVADQSAVAEFLGDPASHAGAVETVERIDTHAALVFLAGPRVYKIKRAVRFSFMDFSTIEKRTEACVSELRLNRRTAPELYLGLVPILRCGAGFAFGALIEEPDEELALPAGTEEVAVAMRRFDQDKLFDRLAQRGALGRGLIEELARAVVALHAAAAPAGPPFGGAEGLTKVIAENAEDLAEFPQVLPAEAVEACLAASRAKLDALAGLLDARRQRGLVRRCHGDLHLRNIVLIEGRPVLFDCIEFDAAIGTIDVGYDIAFLLMDLDYRERRDLANAALNRYLDTAARAGLGDPDWLAALPLFLGLRAGVRAKVTAPAAAAEQDAAKAGDLAAEAHRYLAAATGYLQPTPPRLVAIGGLSGTGKSTLARDLAPDLGACPGALVLRSDQIRKRLAGVPETETLPESAYGPESAQAVYAEIARLGAMALAAGHSVVMDAVSARPAERALFERVAREAGVPFDGLWLEAAPETLKARVGARRSDASDADARVVEAQLGYALGEIAWRQVRTHDGPDATSRRARAVLGLPEAG